MKEEGYNGYTNYETWLVMLWIDNEQSSHEYWLDMAKSIDDSVQLARAMQDHFEECRENVLNEHVSLFFSDMLNAAFSHVNWMELSEYIIENAREIAC